MKVLLINGSPHVNGVTYIALSEIATTLEQNEISAEIYNLGEDEITPCRNCGACEKLGSCVIGDNVNEFLEKAKDCDGFVIGAPAHYDSVKAVLIPFLDRAFFANFMSGREIFKHKPGFAVVSTKRSGTTATLGQLNKYFTFSQMPIITGRYWNTINGYNAEEAKQDLEGMQNLKIAAKNMAYFLKCKEAGLKAGITPPEIDEEVIYTNFMR